MEALQFILIIISIILGLVALALFLKSRRTDSKLPDGPSPTNDSSLKIQVVAHPFKFSDDPGNPLNDQIVEAVNRMGATGKDAEEKFQNCLERLKPNADKVTVILLKEYTGMPEQQYLDRWSVVQLLIDLKHPSSLPFFDKLLQTPIPPERFSDPSFTSSVGEEVIIRTTAVEGLVRMTKENNDAAAQLLLKHITHENFSVKRACIQGYLEAGGNNARERLEKLLNENDRYILNIKRQDVRNISQPKANRTTPRAKLNDKPGMPPPFS
jgi:hypothetical protein